MTKVANINLSRDELQRIKMQNVFPFRSLQSELEAWSLSTDVPLKRSAQVEIAGSTETQTPACWHGNHHLDQSICRRTLRISKIKIARYFKPLQEMLFLFQMTFSFLGTLMF